MKRCIALIVTLVLCVSLCNCTTKETDVTKITMSHCQGEWCHPVLQEIVDAYKAETGIEVELIYIAAESYDQWREAQLAAGSEPDIMWGMKNAGTYYTNGKILDLTDYYNSESPFSGHPWKDDYLDGILANCYDDNGEDLIMNTFLRVERNLYYNKDIFNELKLEVPETWSEFIDVCKVIKEAGYIPFSIMNASPVSFRYMLTPILEDCYANSGKAERLDVITENGFLDDNELLLGIKSGVIKYTDPEFVTYLKIIKELVPYYNVGFNSVGWEFVSLFNEGKSAMQINGSWYPNEHMVNGTKVNYGVALLPYVDSELYEGARNEQVRYKVSPPEGEIVVTQKAADEGRADAAVNFLQFLSNANGGGKLWTDKTMFLPVIKDVEFPDLMKPFADFNGETERVYSADRMVTFDKESNVEYEKMLAEYLENDQTPEEFAQEVQKLYSKGIDDVIALNPVDVNSYIDKIK